MPKLKHIAVLAFPFASHPAPLLSLVRRLAETAPEAEFSFLSTAQSNEKLFADGKRSDGIKSYNIRDGLPLNYVFSGNPQEPVEFFLKAALENFKDGMKAAVEGNGREITCIITDAFFWFAADMAQELDVPWVALWTSGPRPMLVHMETDLVRQRVGLNGDESRRLDFLPGFLEIRPSDLPAETMCGDINSGFPAMLHKMGLMLPRATAVVVNSFQELEPEVVDAIQSRVQKCLEVGPFAIASPENAVSDPEGCLKWLDGQKPESVVYICFGSVISPPPHEVAALAEALEETGFSFLWSFRGNPEEKLPKEFLERSKEKGKIVSWSPQLKVLQHAGTGVFLSHAGWNAISESIVGCVPLVCRPFFGEQGLNARTVEAVWGTGMGIQDGKMSKDGVSKALKLVLLSEEGKKMREKLRGLQEKALKAVQPNGSSTRNFKTLAEIVSN